MIKAFKEKLMSATLTILPVVIIVLVVSIFFPIKQMLLESFILSSLLLIIGCALFTFGADLSMVFIGNKIGKDLVRSKKVWIILLVSLIIGTFITIAEPDLLVLADQITSIPNVILILCISFGVGFCVLLSAARSLFGWNLNVMLLIGFIIIFILSFLVPEDFIPFAFDSGGVTTGTMSIPFILTVGMGLVANRVDDKAKENGFGLVALSSTGPIIMVLLLGIFYDSNTIISFDASIYENYAFSNYFPQLISCFVDVLLAILPVVVAFIIYVLITKNVTKIEIRKIIFGFVITTLGLTIFLQAANIGFLNMGYYLGVTIASSAAWYLLIPLIMVLSYFIAVAEPAVIILIEQIKEYTEGAVSSKILKFALAIGVSLASALSLLRVFSEPPFFYYAITGYGIAFILTFAIPKVFTAIAFDAGGATGGSLTTAFLLPISIGACVAKGGNVYADAFGLASMVSLIPIITIEIVGLVYNYKELVVKQIEKIDDSIISYEWEVQDE